MSVAVLDASPQALTLTDRCDRCLAQAYVMTRLPSGLELLWCGHHFAENEPLLLAQGASVAADQRHVLTV
jgi:hypothetical protein